MHAVRRGLPILSEKPIADTWQASIDILRAVQGAGLKMQVVQNAVVAKCRVPTEDEYNPHLGFKAYTPSGMRIYREACEPVDLSRHQPEGLLLRFVDAEDLKAWGEILSAWIPQVLARDANADWSVFGWGG